MWQEITIAIIVIAAFGWVGWKIYKFLTAKNKTSCDNCAGCELKDIMKDRKENCKDQQEVQSPSK